MSATLVILPCLDSAEMAAARKAELDILRNTAAALGRSAVQAARDGFYVTRDGQKVIWKDAAHAARAAKRSISPDAKLPVQEEKAFAATRIQVTNETTLGASRRLVERGLRPLALNFANGHVPGGGFLNGAKAQEEALCRSSALYETLVDDLMYEAHRGRPEPDSTDWAIYSPDVPVFRTDEGTELEEHWPLSFVTCDAPYAPDLGQPRSGDLLQKRIHRVQGIARAFGHTALVLGAWGCGAFENDPNRTAGDFRRAIENAYRGAFSEIVFAITDWSSERTFLAPFRNVFASTDHT
jgi:uncharacterized protein (TIGR02452 family)